jgi:hypothetical protein
MVMNNPGYGSAVKVVSRPVSLLTDMAGCFGLVIVL